MEDEVILQWARTFGPGGWKYISPKIGNKSDLYYCKKYDELCAIYKNTGLIERSLAEKLCNETKLLTKDDFGKDSNFEVYLETESGSLWKQLMIKLYRRYKVFGAESMTKIEYRNLSYFINNCLDEENGTDSVLSEDLQQTSSHYDEAAEIIDSSIIEAIDNTMTYEENNPFPSPIQILSVNDYRRLIHSLYLKRPSPDAAFSLTSHFNARHYLQNRVIHISKPVGSSSTTRSIDYPLVNTSLGLIPLSYVQTPIETAELRCCGFVKVPLYELDSSIPIELHLPEPLHVQQWEQWPVPDDRKRRRERKVREKMRKEEKEQPTKKMKEEMMEEKKKIETSGNDGNAENSAVTSGEAMQKKQTGEETRF